MSRFAPQQRCDDGKPNTFAPEGASRCRALTSSLKGPVGGSKRRFFSMNWGGLNAFTSKQFIDWLERKLEQYQVGKVVPDATTLEAAYRRAAAAHRRAAELELAAAAFFTRCGQAEAADRHKADALRLTQLARKDDARADALLEAATASAVASSLSPVA